MKPVVVPAIITSSQGELDCLLASLGGEAERIMLDIMDGRIVPTTSLDFHFHVPEGFIYELHLMVQEPLQYLEKLKSLAQIAILHVETLGNVEDAIKRVHDMGLQVYLAVSPDTPVSRVAPYLKDLDGVLVMTVYPGRWGAPFVPETLEKIREIRKLSKKIRIEVDGAMNPENVRKAKQAGADIFAAGSFIMKAKDPQEAIRTLLAAASESK